MRRMPKWGREPEKYLRGPDDDEGDASVSLLEINEVADLDDLTYVEFEVCCNCGVTEVPKM